MKESLGLYVFLLITWISVSTYWYTCRIQNLCIPENLKFTEGALLSAEASSSGLKIIGTNIGAADNIRFIHSRQHPFISGGIKVAFNNVETYLSLNDDLALEVTGTYASTEKNNTLLDNLGLARAEAFKAWMVMQGADRSQIITRFTESDSLPFIHDTLSNGLAFRIVNKPEEERIGPDELKAVERRLKENYQPFYFESTSANLKVNDHLKAYVRDLRIFLDAYPDKNITLVGHTDESGSAEANVRIGRSRAEYVRQLLSETGINYQQMRTNSKGESMPVASNKTKEGQSKNRRVEIQFNP